MSIRLNSKNSIGPLQKFLGIGTTAKTETFTPIPAKDFNDPLSILGCTGKEIMYNTTGYIICVTFMIFNVPRLTIADRASAEHKAYDFDITTVNIIHGDRIQELPDFIDPNALPIKLGQLVQDKISKFVGIVTQIVYQINGCVYCVVKGKYNEDKCISPDIFISYQRLEQVNLEKLNKNKDNIYTKKEIIDLIKVSEAFSYETYLQPKEEKKLKTPQNGCLPSEAYQIE